MMRSRHLKSQAGFSLLEIMFGMGVLVVAIYLVVGGITQMETITKDTKNISTTERQIAMIVDNIRTSLSHYQISYDATAATREAALDLANLPMAWDPGFVIPVESCKPGCPGGRYGFVVQPMPTAVGLYVVTLRLTHKDWKEQYKEFQFLVTVK